MKYLILTIVLLSGFRLVGQPLETYLKLAVENNPMLRARQAEMEAPLQRSIQAGRLPDPQVSLEFFPSPMMLPMGNQVASLSVMQMFPLFGTLEANKNVAIAEVNAKYQAFRSAKNELIFKVRSAWYPICELKQTIRFQQENIRLLETDKELAVFKFQHGQGRMVDAILTDLMIDEAKTRIALLEQKQKVLHSVFNLLLNRPPDAPVVAADSLVIGVLPPDHLVDSLRFNPELAVWNENIQVAKASVIAARKQTLPGFTAGVTYTPLVRRNEEIHLLPNTGGDMVMGMVGVSLPVWKKKNKAMVEENRVMQLMYEAERQNAENELLAEYIETRFELEEAVQMHQLLDTRILKTRQALDLLVAAYSANGENFEEILEMRRNLLELQISKTEMVTRFHIGKARLAFLTGNGLD